MRDDTPGALPECPQLKLLRMEGEIYFGAATHVAEHLHALRQNHPGQKHLLVMSKSMNGFSTWPASSSGRPSCASAAPPAATCISTARARR